MPSLTCLKVCKVWQKDCLVRLLHPALQGSERVFNFHRSGQWLTLYTSLLLAQFPHLRNISTPEAAETGDKPALKVRILVPKLFSQLHSH